MSERPVLVTGAFGLVGSALVDHLAGAGRRVVATDLDGPATRAAARAVTGSGAVEVRFADLTDPDELAALMTDVRPGAVVHLAAVIPPQCYADRALARRVNVEATRMLVAEAQGLSDPPRVVLASSVAVYGARNPHRFDTLLTASTPLTPSDLYGAHKVEAEAAVMSSGLEWVVLRFGGVLSPSPPTGVGLDLMDFQGVLPADGRLQTVDVRDVARACAAALDTDATGEVFLVGGDESHRVLQGALGDAMAGAMGLHGVLPPGRPGNPERDGDWFATDHMDTVRSEQVLAFQRHPLPELLAELSSRMGWRRIPLGAVSPLARAVLRRRAPYRDVPGAFADPWGQIRSRWGDPSPDAQAD